MRYPKFILTIISLLFATGAAWTQTGNVNVRLDVIEVSFSRGDDPFSDKPDPRWVFVGQVVGNFTAVGSTCVERENSNYGTFGVNSNVFNYNSNANIQVFANSSVLIVNMGAWEEDRGGNCSYDCCAFLANNDDVKTNGSAIIPLSSVLRYEGNSHEFPISGNGFSARLRVSLVEFDSYTNDVLSIQNANGTGPAGNLCENDPYRIDAGVGSNFLNYTLLWEKSTNGGSTWSEVETTFNKDFIEVTASFPITDYRVSSPDGLWEQAAPISTISLGDSYKSGPTPPSGNQIQVALPVFCDTGSSAKGSIEVTGLGNVSDDSEFSIWLYEGDYTLNEDNIAAVSGVTKAQLQSNPVVFSDLDPGSYSIRVGELTETFCVGLREGIQVQPVALPELFSVTPNNARCNGDLGSVFISARPKKSGTNVYELIPVGGGSTISQSTSSTFTNITNVPVGTYDVRITNSNGCSSPTQQITITEPSALTAAITATPPTVAGVEIPCNGGNEPITLSFSGGNGGYRVSGGPYSNRSVTSPANILLGAGTTNLTLSDYRGCSVNLSQTLTEPATELALTVDPSTPSISCQPTGTISFAASGGIPPYTYYLNGDDSNSNSTGDFTGLAGGNHRAFVRDAAGCVRNEVFSVDQTTSITFDTENFVPVSCWGESDGSLNFSASGGAGTIVYSFNGGAFNSTTSYTGLPAGTYEIIARDDEGCELITDITVSQPSRIFMTSIEPTQVTCSGELASARFDFDDFSAGFGFFEGGEISLDGGSTWQEISPNFPDEAPYFILEDFFTPRATPYNIKVRDPNGCESVNTILVEFPDPGVMSISSTSSTGETCVGANDGSVTVQVQGGRPPYTIELYNGGSVVQTATGVGQESGTATYTFTDLSPSVGANGNANVGYGIVVSDDSQAAGAAGNCQVTFPSSFSAPSTVGGSDALITVTPGSDPEIVSIVNNGPLLNCFNNGFGNNGEYTVQTVTGGTPPYEYSSDGLNWQSSNILTGLSNFETLYVRDVNGCTDSETFSNDNFVSFPSASGVQIQAATSGCEQGIVQVNISGGTGGPYVVELFEEGDLFCDEVAPDLGQGFRSGTTSGSSITFDDIAAGTYEINIYDQATGCYECFNPTFTISEITGPSLAVTGTTKETCTPGNDGSFTLSVSGGTPPYTVQNNNGAGTLLSSAPYNITYNDLTDSIPNTFSVTDATGCLSYITQIVERVSTIEGTATPTDVTGCSGDPSGSVLLSATGGTPPYNVVWFFDEQQGNIASDGGTLERTGLVAGEYEVGISDANGCFTLLTAFVDQPSGVVAEDPVTTDATCTGVDDGTASVSASGGTAPLEYSLDGGGFQAGSSFSGIAPGDHTITIRDAALCTTDVDFTIGVGADITAISNVDDTNCNGESTGSITITPSGGAVPYSYSLDGGTPQSSSVFADLAAGTYEVTVFDDNGCSVVVSTIVVNEPDVLTATVEVVADATCLEPTGELNALPVGGTAPYSYVWDGNNSLTSQTLTNAAAGPHTVVITDANGCTTSASASITAFNPISLELDSSVDEACGQANGSITVTVVDGTAPFSFTWSNGAPDSPTATGLVAGTYTVDVIDANGCEDQLEVTIGEIAPPSLVIDATENSLCTDGNGSITVEAIGGTAPFQYSIDGGALQASPIFDDLDAGTYTFDVVDALGCEATVDGSISLELPPNVSLNTIDAACGQDDGEIQAVVTGGNPSYSYAWSVGGQSGAEITDLAPGTYTVTVTDQNGCEVIESATINEIAAPTVSLASSADATCGDSNGEATVSAAGGTPPYDYNWSVPNPNVASVSNLPEGTHFVTVTDNRGCETVQEIVIDNIPGPSSLGFDVTNSICEQGNGSITVSVTGGTAPFDYNWNNGNPNSATASGLSSGTYSVTVTDANGCTIVDQASVTFIESPSLAVESTENSLCEDGNGSITVVASGGTPPYNYNWSGGIGSAGATVTDLNVGTYSITVTDANNCTDIVNATINLEPAPIGFVDSFDDSDCGADNGSIEIGIVGGTGTAPLSYSWSHNGSLDDNEATGLAPGTYTVTITDANGCEDIVEQTINERPGPSLSLGSTTADICGQSIGAATVVPSGGVSPYSYEWSGNPGVNSPTLSGVLSGTYTVTITDFYGCFSSLEVTIDEIPGPTVVLDGIDDLPCVQGEVRIRISVDEGTFPFEYDWDHDSSLDGPIASDLTSGTYTVTVTDANNCTDVLEVVVEDVGPPSLERGTVVDSDCGANNGSITVIPSGGTPPYQFNWGQLATTDVPTLTGVPPGTYSIQVVDANGCTANVGATVDEVGGAEIEIVEVNSSGCENDNGSITVQGVGGVEPYSWAWDHDSDLDGPVATGLPGGDYSVTLTDNFGCERSTTITVEETPPFVATIANVEPSLCEDGNGSLSISASGGQTPYSIDWNILPNGAGFNVSNLASGNYEATVTDANGCEVILSQAVQLIEGPTVEISQQGEPGCFGPDGFIDLLISGGTTPYDISWSHDAGLTGDFAGNLAADDYSVTVTDANGCETILSTTLTAPTDIAIEITEQSPENCDLADGSVTISVVGQTGDFTYSWSHDSDLDGPTATGLEADTYTVTVSADGFCDEVQTIEIAAVAGPSLSDPNITDSDCNASTGVVSFTVSGGTEPYTYDWDHDSNLDSPTASDLAAGSYTLIVTDANGCSVEGVATVSNLEAPNPSIETAVNPSCLDNDGSISVQVTGGTQPYTYDWSHDDNADGPDLTGLGAGVYSLTVTDVNGCQGIVSQTLEDDNPLLLELVSRSNSICEDGNGSISVAASGGGGGYQLTWEHDNNLTSSNIDGLAAGSYTATVTDANGCTASLTVSIELIAGPEVSVFTQTEAVCIDNGSITLAVTGGVEPYNYTWSHNDQLNSNTATGLAVGSYTATVLDANNCSSSITVEVGGVGGPALTASSVDPACTNDNGSISIQANGTDGPFEYNWSHDQNLTGNEATNLPAGDYTVTVTNARGCSSIITQQLTFAAGVSASIASQSDSECVEGNGTISITTDGGEAPYTVAWSHDDNATGLSLENLASGDYSATVTDANGCEDIVSTTIGLVEGPTIVWTTEAGASCDDNNGALSASVSGGVPPYTYAWSHDDDLDGPIALGLAPGDYTLSVTDQNGCTTTLSSTIQIGELGLNITSSTDPSCSASTDGTITAMGTGGVTPYTYVWSNGATGETISGLGAGTYTVTMTDASGCESSVEATLTAADDLQLSFNVLQSVCEGGSNGEVEVSAVGGTGNYTYNWDAPGNPTSAAISGLAPGEYGVTVTDDSGCGTAETITIEEVPGITLSLSSSPSCLDALNGTASVVATGGTGNFSYLWDDPNGQTTATASNLLPGVYTVVVSDDHGCTNSNSISVSASPAVNLEIGAVTQPDCTTNPAGAATVIASGGTGAISYQWNDANGQTSATASGLDPGTYEVVATDENGCTASVTVEIFAPGDLEVSVSNITPPACAGDATGSAGVFVNNGSGDYTYLWDDPAAQTTASLSNVPAGSYQVRVTDAANGCFVVQEVTISDPEPVSISLISATPPPCGQSTGGEALIEASGGAGNYSYSWNDPNGQSSAFVNGLASGDYEVTVTDENGCSTTLIVTIPEGQELSASITDFSGPSCADQNDGFATVSVVGGSANLTYQWNDPAFQTTATATGLSPGTYTVEIMDDGDCSTSVSVEIPSTPALTLSLASSTQPSCSGFNDGELSITIAGGTGSYTILWDDANAQTTATASNLTSGVYTVTVTDENGCDLTETFVLEDAAALSLTLETIEATCFSGSADGSITASIEGGTGPYTYQWDDPAAQTTATASNLAAGTYMVTVTDANGCNISQSVDLGASASEILVTEGQNSPSCEGGTDGDITIQVAGGAGGYTYAWSTGAATASLSNLGAGSYSLTITDAQGCTAERDFILEDGPLFTVDLGNVDTTICEGEVLFFDFSDLDYDVSWTGPNGFSSTDKIVLLEDAGEYTVAVTNAGGCSDEATINLSFGSDLFQALFLAPTDVVVDQEVVVVEVSWPAPDMVEWVYDQDSVNFNGSNQNQYFFSFPYPGEIDLTMIASAGGCEGILTKTLVVHPDSSSIPSAFQGQQEIIQFSLSPNPNMGDFNTIVELSDPKPIVLSVFGLDGVEVDRRILNGQAVYSETYNLSVTPGVYIMVLQTPTQRKSIVFSILSP